MPHFLAEKFNLFAESECKDSSPLYHELARSVAKDEGMLEIASQAKPGQPVPNLFFAAAHYLLCRRPDHPLGDYYASISQDPCEPSGAFPSFRDFVIDQREQVQHLVKARLVQTNEARRSAYLFPSFAFAARLFPNRPLALIEIGSSAGLNLIWDKYAYSYGTGVIYGETTSSVLVTSSFRGGIPDVLSDPLPRVTHRIGIDIHTVDVMDPDQVDWLRALVWPEHDERRSLMDAALALRASTSLDLREGNGFSMMREIALEVPADSVVCIYHTHVANQVPEAEKLAFVSLVKELGQARDLIHVFNNIKPTLHLTAFSGGKCIDVPLAKTDAHARWIEWTAVLPA